ncbi:SDR family NAD(P)-dependent oxidoreductase [Paenibacillus sp. NEAU-GSW1]|uniref:SDR family NAD(P)-dependent oxidoreductase n=1 Tax=Paenibacillus sp. NEAU-GSW1 TaxID=2682486 RepID=UPI0012E31E44|nr:SDR family NAD(P)-dependent oxidoreductase [Paenibacillus sp. NEAU-GSW1]MUT64711.1 SDR family NAD(P)-dependent oxidoreductase [Paenibacillus sp. NEAU-GSW1]
MNKAAKSILITGGNAGLGYACAQAIAASDSNLHLIIASRNRQRVETAVRQLIQKTGNANISAMVLDLASLESIRQFAARLPLAGLPPLHAIVCNAGVQNVQGTQTTDDGIEATFGINHLGHFLLVRLLLDQLAENGRIIVVSSDAHDIRTKTGMPAPRYFHPSTMADPAQIDKALSGLSPLEQGRIRYTTSKLANLYFTYELSRLLQQANRAIAINAFNPGMMPGKDSSLPREYSPLIRFVWNHVLPLTRFFREGIRSTKQSGADLANLTLRSPLVSGTYWDGSKEIPSSEESYSRDRAAELWRWSSAKVNMGIDL